MLIFNYLWSWVSSGDWLKKFVELNPDPKIKQTKRNKNEVQNNYNILQNRQIPSKLNCCLEEEFLCDYKQTKKYTGQIQKLARSAFGRKIIQLLLNWILRKLSEQWQPSNSVSDKIWIKVCKFNFCSMSSI